jgi:hypothetical protein
LVTFVNDNEDHLTSIEKIHSDFTEIEDEIFMIRVKQDIIVVLMKDYIDEWLKKQLVEIVNPK